MPEPREILVIGATGTQGRAVVRHLLRAGMRVRGLTRRPTSATAKRLAEAGATLCSGNLDQAASVEAAMRGVSGVYLVTEFFKNGIPAEIRQGRLVADLCARLRVAHLVHASVNGADRDSGVPHFESKGAIERHIRALGLPATVLRPAIFMEDLTEAQYVPPASWGMMPKLVGPDRPVKWIAVDDIGAAAAAVFARPEEFLGGTIPLVGDVRSMAEARALFAQVRGRRPFALPMPTALFRRLVGEELVLMWRWLATETMEGDPKQTRLLVPEVKDMAMWLREKAR
jgi:uncharacterized protein YbjT (DUF2867 family)